MIPVLGILALAGAASAQPPAQQERPLISRKGTPLSEIVKLADRAPEVVVIEKDQSPPLFIEPPAGTRQLDNVRAWRVVPNFRQAASRPGHVAGELLGKLPD
jgi:hypothetical protein